ARLFIARWKPWWNSVWRGAPTISKPRRASTATPIITIIWFAGAATGWTTSIIPASTNSRRRAWAASLSKFSIIPSISRGCAPRAAGARRNRRRKSRRAARRARRVDGARRLPDPGSHDLPGRDRFALAFEHKLAPHGAGKLPGDSRVGFFPDENFTGARFSLQARRDVDRVAKDGVIGHCAAAHVADERFAGADAGAEPQVFRRAGAHRGKNFPRRVDGALGVIRALDGRAEKRHHLIADQLVQGTVVKKNRPRGDFVEAVQLDGQRRGLEPLRERGEAAHIDEQYRNYPRLPARRSELVSERAEIGVLSRRADLQQAKGQRTDSQ